jgi:hypothetical protein
LESGTFPEGMNNDNSGKHDPPILRVDRRKPGLVLDTYQKESKKFGHSMNDKYASARNENLEEEFKKNTAGLVSASEFKRRKDNLDKGISSDIFTPLQKRDSDRFFEDMQDTRVPPKKKIKKAQLSFQDDCDDSESSESQSSPSKTSMGPFRKPSNPLTATPTLNTNLDLPKPVKKMKKDPLANTKYLPDAEREEELASLKQDLTLEYYEKEKIIREQEIEVTFPIFPSNVDCRFISSTGMVSRTFENCGSKKTQKSVCS